MGKSAAIARSWRIGAVILAGLAVLLLGVAIFPWGVLKPLVQSRLEARFGRPVVIGRMERVDHFGLAPTLAIEDVRIAQPAWAGRGDFIRVARAQATLPLWSLLTGEFAARDIEVRGLALSLVRRKDGRTNWEGSGGHEKGGGTGEPGTVTIADSMISYRDAKRDRSFALHVASDVRAGVRASGSGMVSGTPVRIAIAAPPIAGGGRWPFRASIEGPALTMAAVGTMDRPLDTDHMTLNLTSRARDLKLIDAIIEAGLFGTQPVAITAHVRRDPQRWTIRDLKGTVGQSDIAGALTVNKVEGRTKLDGEIASTRFDFDDLASDKGLAKARALRQAIGPRIIPNTRIDLSKIGKTDGVLRVRLGTIMSGGAPTAIRSIAGTMTLDHRLLRLDGLKTALRSGTLTGHAVIDQREGRPSPLVTIDLRLTGAEFAALTKSRISGALAGRLHLVGTGKTVRQAVGASDGAIGMVVRDGSLPKRIAYAAGFALGKALIADDKARAGLRCGVLRLSVHHGQGQAGPLIIDTTESRLQGEGRVTFPDEAIALRLSGDAKHKAIVRLNGHATVGGTISAPRLIIPQDVKSVGNILKAIGRGIRGRQPPPAAASSMR